MLPFVIKDDENKVKTDQVVKQTMHIEPLFPKPLVVFHMRGILFLRTPLPCSRGVIQPRS